MEYKSFGYRVLVLTKDESGNTVTGEHTGTDTNAYSSVFSGSTEYSIKDYFGYEYACLATITGLDANKDFFQLVIFPYTVSLSNEKAYGEAMSLTYAGESDADGYMMTNSTGADFVVMTQQERANYYEHFVLSLLESKACVGWSWYRFRDNDQGLWATADGKYTDLRMLFVSYGNPTYPVTYADADGNVYSNADLGVTTSNWKTALVQTYEGEPMASNQNCNKGLFNANYSTTVAVYTYDASGNLTGVNSYEVDDSTLTAIPANGTTLTGKNGMTFTLGTSGTTKTVLTTYKGKYLALTDSIKNISANIMGIVNYLDADGHIQ